MRLKTTARLAVLLLTLSPTAARRSQAQSNQEEYQVKAAFLYHFAQLVEWPVNTPQPADHAMLFCTVGDDPFQGELEATVAGKSIGSRVIRVRHLQRSENMQDCQIVFLGKGESHRIPSEMADLKKAPVLTIGETTGFLEAGGMVGFLTVEHKIRFAINLDAANAAGLRIGSRLLVLAQTVIGEHRER